MANCPRCGQPNDAQASKCAKCSMLLSGSGVAELAADPKQLIGRIVNGKYQVLSILGEGGMGVVYKVRHLILQHKNTFALKILHPRVSLQPDFHARFLREVEIAMELTHENIIQIRDFGMTEQNLLFYTMDYFPGRSLKEIIESEKPIPCARVVEVASQVLLALGEAHKAGIVHRDLKPENVLIDRPEGRQERVRILDFGIAKIQAGDDAEDKGLTAGNVIGTPKYMSPEQASGEPIDGRSDLYALGVILFEMLTGSAPFEGKTTRSILMAQITAPPPKIEQVAPGLKLPSQIEALVYQLLEKDREARPKSAADVLAALAGKTVVATRPNREAPAAPRAAPAAPAVPARRRGPGMALAAAVLALVAALVGVFTLPSRSGRTPGAHAEGGDPRESGGPAGPEKKLRCAVCGATYARGEKVGDMCHGEPLIEAE